MALKFRLPGFGGGGLFGRGTSGRTNIPFPKGSRRLESIGNRTAANQGSRGIGAPKTPNDLKHVEAAAGLRPGGPTTDHSTDKILTEIQRNRAGLARPNRFKIVIPNLPASVIAGYASQNVAAETLNILCNSVSLPGKNMSTVEHVTYRQPQKLPNGYTVDEIEFEFYLTNNYDALEFFQAWQRSMISTDDYLMNYTDMYMKDVEVFQLDTNDNEIYGTKLMEAYPVNVQPIELSNDDESVGKLRVTMAFFDFNPITYSGNRSNFTAAAPQSALPTIMGGTLGASTGGPFSGSAKSANNPFSIGKFF